MKTTTQSFVTRRERGSALVTVIMFSLVLLLLAGSITSWSLHERQLNARSGLWLESRNAAEAVTEYACFQVAQAFNTRVSPTFGSTGTNPVSVPSSLSNSFFSGSHVDTSSVEVHAGNMENFGLYYIDPTNPSNDGDPFNGRYVSRRDVTVIGKATVTPATGAPITTYIQEKVSVRGAPLLAFAIFYSNNDLEFGETPQMDIYGPVHVNGNLFVGPAGSSPQSLGLHGTVTASGAVFHAWRGTTTTAQEGGSGMSDTTAVNFSTDGVGATSSTMVNMRNSSGVWQDSTMGADLNKSGLDTLNGLLTAAVNKSFAQNADQTWHGNLKTGAMGIEAVNPLGFSEVIAHDSTANKDIYATDPAADAYGYGPHALIEPEKALPSSSDTYYAGKQGIEEGKFSRNAALYVTVDASGTITLYGDPNSAPAGAPTSSRHPVDTGRLKLVDSTDTTHFPKGVFQYIPYTQSSTGNNVKTGIYDQRQDKQVNLLQINMAALKSAVADIATSSAVANGTDIVNTYSSANTKWGTGTAGTGYNEYDSSSTGWNGGIYIDVTQPSSSSQQTGIILSNGKVTGSSNSMMPNGTTDSLTAPNSITGLTIATNAPAYILGAYNTDGSVTPTSSTGNSALWPDDYPTRAITSSIETPAAVAADAITVLSPNYFGTAGSSPTYLVPNANDSTYTQNPSSSNAYSSYNNSTTPPSASGDVEIAAALITGTVTTSKDSTGTQMYSGGVHNLPRFLENYGSGSSQKTVAIRGSMVSMYNSLIATAGWSQSYYSAPKRQWGYDQLFANGKFPPICPSVISYRRVDFTYLTASDYSTLATSIH